MENVKQNQPQAKVGIKKDRPEQINQEQLEKKGNDDSNKIWQFFCSVKLAVVIILVMVVACVLGTVILQEKTPNEYVARYGEGLATFFRITELTNVFYSYWFSILLLLLCANLICCTIKRWRNTILQTGFIITHLSIVLILIGGVVKLQLGVKGGVNVYEGKTVDYFLTQMLNRQGTVDYVKKSLPFTIALDDFILEKNEPKFQLVSYIKSKDKQKVLDTKIGNRQKVPGSDYKVKIIDYAPDAELKQEPVNTADTPENPAALVKLFSSEKVVAEGWLLAYDRNSYDNRKQNIRIEYCWYPSQQEFDNAINSIGIAQTKLSLMLPGKSLDFPLELNKTFKIEGTGYTVRFLQYVFNYGDRRPLEEQLLENPAAQIEINGAEGVETRWVFEKFPDWDKMHPAKYKDLKFTCSGISNFYLTKDTVKILQSAEGKKSVVYVKDKRVVDVSPWEVDKKYNVGGTDYQVVVSKYFPSFDFKKEVIRKSDKVGTPAICVEVDGPKGKISDWIFSSNQYATWYTDNNFALIYEPTGESVKHYISKLRILDDGKTVAEKAIKVNDPVEYKGYVIYQSSYDPEGGKYSGLQIVKDPGIPIAYAGFGLLCFGVVFIFYIKPFLRKKQKKEV